MTGTIPSWAAGSLYRTGPGQCTVKDTRYGKDGIYYISHWFDGLAHTHRFDIVPSQEGEYANGQPEVKVMYSSRRQSEELAKYIQKKGAGRLYTFGQKADPCVGLYSKFMSVWKNGDINRDRQRLENVSVTVQTPIPGLPGHTNSINRDTKAPNISGHRANSVWLATDTCSLRQLDASTLEPVGFETQVVLHPELTGPLSSAHSHRDPVTGDYFNYNLHMAKTATYRIFRVSASTGKTDILATIQKSNLMPAYIHSFYLSESFVTLCVPSSHLAWKGLKIAWNRNVLDAIVPFDEKLVCKWFVVDRLHGQGVVAEFETPAGFFFHTINSFEEQVKMATDGTTKQVDLYCDVVEFPNTDIMRLLYYDVMLNRNDSTKAIWGSDIGKNLHPRFARWKFRVDTPAASSSMDKKRRIKKPSPKPEKVVAILGPHIGELPTINPAYQTKRYRYVYSLPNRGRSTMLDTLVKTDIDTGNVIFWNNLQGHTPSEAIFVARPGAKEEDDGVLLSVVLDGTQEKSYLLCLDAKTMTEMGRADVNFAIGFGFHGVHVTEGSDGMKSFGPL